MGAALYFGKKLSGSCRVVRSSAAIRPSVEYASPKVHVPSATAANTAPMSIWRSRDPVGRSIP